VQSIRKNWKKYDFSDIFWIFLDFSEIKKVKKTSKWTEKNEHKHIFVCFSENESIHGLVFFFQKKRSFFSIHLGPFCVCGAMLSRHFDFSKIREQTDNNSARFFLPHFHPLGLCSEHVLLFTITTANR